jgi:hypothetical protein
MLASSFLFPVSNDVLLSISAFSVFTFTLVLSVSLFPFDFFLLQITSCRQNTNTQMHGAKCLHGPLYAFLKLLHALHGGTRENLKDLGKPRANKQMAKSKQRREISPRPRSALSQLHDT